MNYSMPQGMSVVVCCYNSAKRLGDTFRALALQETSATLNWEVILVDNASNDNTATIGTEIWNSLNPPVSIRVVAEPQPGLINARRTGIQASRYSMILFCDDDNWLERDYLQGIFDLLDSDNNIAACGGMGIPIFEGPEPYWFYKYSEAFAVGSQELNIENGQLLNLYGAGMAVRKEAILNLERLNHKSLLQGRTGTKLSSAEDTEMTYSFVLMGYKLACSNDLKFYHFLPKGRLTFEYLNRLFVSFGTDGPIRNIYYSYISDRPTHKMIRVWFIHFILAVFRLIKYLILPPKKYGRKLYFDWSKAYLLQLIRMLPVYNAVKKQIRSMQRARNMLNIKSLMPLNTKTS